LTEATKRIGYKLVIKRLPKKRLFKLLKKGKIDLYPLASWTPKREKFLYFIPNNITTRLVVVSLLDKKPIDSLNDIKGKLLIGKGDNLAELVKHKHKDIKIIALSKANMAKKIKFLRQGKADYTTVEEKAFLYFLKKQYIKDPKDISLRANLNAITKELTARYLAFSRKSKHFKGKANPNYDKAKTAGIDNFPVIIQKDCVAYKLQEALKQMNKDGTASKIINKYFK
jgi:ABC-type amino acid transport substrate-binding protein